MDLREGSGYRSRVWGNLTLKLAIFNQIYVSQFYPLPFHLSLSPQERVGVREGF